MYLRVSCAKQMQLDEHLSSARHVSTWPGFMHAQGLLHCFAGSARAQKKEKKRLRVLASI